MQKKENIKSYTASELREMRESGHDLSNWQKLDSLSDDELNKMVAEDSDEKYLNIDWDSATVVYPVKKQQLTLRIDTDIIEFF